MSVEYTLGTDADTETTLQATDHARQRYQQRTNSGWPEVRLDVAWQQAVSVGAPDVDGNARLYPPEDLLIVVRGGVIRTVLYPEHERLNDDHLVGCPSCEQLYHPEGNGCPWCGHDSTDSNE